MTCRWSPRILAWTFALFFLPMMLLGTISPQVIRLAVPDVASRRPGGRPGVRLVHRRGHRRDVRRRLRADLDRSACTAPSSRCALLPAR